MILAWLFNILFHRLTSAITFQIPVDFLVCQRLAWSPCLTKGSDFVDGEIILIVVREAIEIACKPGIGTVVLSGILGG